LQGTGYDGDDLDDLLKEAETPVKLAGDKARVVVEVDDEEAGKALVAQLASAGYEAKVELR
jgi:hypothetical protein